MNKLLVINFILYFVYGVLLTASGISIIESPMAFVLLVLMVIVIENVGRTDEIMRRYRG